MVVARGRTAKTASASNLAKNSIDAPAISTTLVATNSPWVWKIGRAWMRTSSAVKRQNSVNAKAFEPRFAWLSIAPLERPVVPEV
jgi:hypothetical protein